MGDADDLRRAIWQAVGEVATAHVLMLREVAILDDAVAAALLGPLDGVVRGEPPAADGWSAIVAAFDERLDALAPAGAGGAALVARGRAEAVAAAMRIVLRERLLGLLGATDAARLALLDLAEAHVFTLMPAFAGARPVQPTTLAHFLGGVAAPLGRAATRLRVAYDQTNESPLGAVALASTGLRIDRDVAADLLGFDRPVAGTFDAVAATDHLPAALEPAAAVAAALRRFLGELLAWLRADPGSLRLSDEWLGPADAALPGFRPPEGVERLVAGARRGEEETAAAARLAREQVYGPTGPLFEEAFRLGADAIERIARVAGRSAALIAGGLEINRAYLANRAGRDHTTSGELADFLMAEEGLDPASARNIATMTVRKAMEQGIEASGITPPMIDAAALLVIGRELGIEIERLGGFLAPRRFLERRTAPGGPAPAATRDNLERERTLLLADERWREAAAAKLRDAAAARERLVAEIARTSG